VNLYQDRVGERELGELVLIDQNLATILQRAEAIERANMIPAVRQVAETPDYNIVSTEGRFVAIAKSLGPVDLFREPLGLRELGRLILIRDSLDEALSVAEELSHQQNSPSERHSGETDNISPGARA
jgi:hypothetical protein